MMPQRQMTLSRTRRRHIACGAATYTPTLTLTAVDLTGICYTIRHNDRTIREEPFRSFVIQRSHSGAWDLKQGITHCQQPYLLSLPPTSCAAISANDRNEGRTDIPRTETSIYSRSSPYHRLLVTLERSSGPSCWLRAGNGSEQWMSGS